MVKVLYVDDEIENINVFKAFSPDEWELFLFTSPTDALKNIDKIDPDLIVSDIMMPGGTTGVDFISIADKIIKSNVCCLTALTKSQIDNQYGVVSVPVFNKPLNDKTIEGMKTLALKAREKHTNIKENIDRFEKYIDQLHEFSELVFSVVFRNKAPFETSATEAELKKYETIQQKISGIEEYLGINKKNEIKSKYETENGWQKRIKDKLPQMLSPERFEFKPPVNDEGMIYTSIEAKKAGDLFSFYANDKKYSVSPNDESIDAILLDLEWYNKTKNTLKQHQNMDISFLKTKRGETYQKGALLLKEISPYQWQGTIEGKTIAVPVEKMKQDVAARNFPWDAYIEAKHVICFCLAREKLGLSANDAEVISVALDMAI